MQVKRLSTATEPTWAVIFEPGEESVAGLTEWAAKQRIRAARLTGIGGFRDVELGFFDPKERNYRRIPVHEQVEVLSLLGDIAMGEEGPQVHAHVVVGLGDGSTRGGHLMSGQVWPTLEVLVSQVPTYLARRHDPATGLAVIDLSASG
jgi:predicted DNA-binding protein with PD1-like motif